jgi:predicted flap endonuclease-1-like 5' DNA nuclease
MTELSNIKDATADDIQKLYAIGIASHEELLERGASPKGRKEIVEQAGVNGDQLLRWLNQADLQRIRGISRSYADLLEAAGVDTVPELAQRKPENLLQKMNEVNQEKQLVRLMPTEALVKDWIQQAKELPRKISY